MTRGKRLAIESVAIDERADALGDKELLDTIAEQGRARIFRPPTVVHRPIAGRAPGVEAERNGPAVAPEHGAPVEVVAVGRETGPRASHFDEEVAAPI